MKLTSLIVSIALPLLAVPLMAQEAVVTSESKMDNALPNVPESSLLSIPLYNNAQIAMPQSIYELEINRVSPLLFNLYHLQQLSEWNAGTIYGIGSREGLQGLGNFNSATVGITQHLGRFTVTGALSGYKYHINRNLYNDFGISGSVSYQINPHFTVSVFGNYSTSNVYDSPAAMPYVNFSCFGGSVRYQTGKTFGMELGVQRVFDPNLNRWHTIPIVAPTVNIGNCAVGIDVGGLLHSIINSGNDYQRPQMPPPGSNHSDNRKGYGSIPGSGPHLLPAKAVKPQ